MLDQDGIASYRSRETTSPSFSGYMHVTDRRKLEETSTSKVSHYHHPRRLHRPPEIVWKQNIMITFTIAKNQCY